MMLRSFRRARASLPTASRRASWPRTSSKELDVNTPSVTTPVRRLSGGNVQKVLVGREIASAPTVLMTAYAVRGLDINASYTIYDLINQQKEKGVAVIYVGEDLDVLLELCDRILVLCGGKVSGIVDARTATKEEIGLMMTRRQGGGSGPCITKVREPLFHIAKRDTLPWKAWGIRLGRHRAGALLCALVTTLPCPTRPHQRLRHHVRRRVRLAAQSGSWRRTRHALLCISLAVTPAFKMRFWNIGAEGQVLAGGLAAAACMILWVDKLPNGLLILIMIAGILAGAIWAVIPAIFKAKWNTNETLFTLMMNYVATQLVAYFIIVWAVVGRPAKVGIIPSS